MAAAQWTTGATLLTARLGPPASAGASGGAFPREAQLCRTPPVVATRLRPFARMGDAPDGPLAVNVPSTAPLPASSARTVVVSVEAASRYGAAEPLPPMRP